MAGAGALIVAHDNVRKRMSVEQLMEAIGGTRCPPSPAKALPVVTFNDEVTFHLNGDEIHVLHVAAGAHRRRLASCTSRRPTSCTWATPSSTAPIRSSTSRRGGTVDGFIAAQEKALALVDDETKIIPGHGAVGDKAALKAAHDMLVKVRDGRQAVAGEEDARAVKAAKPTAELDAQYGKSPFITGDRFTGHVDQSLGRQTGALNGDSDDQDGEPLTHQESGGGHTRIRLAYWHSDGVGAQPSKQPSRIRYLKPCGQAATGSLQYCGPTQSAVPVAQCPKMPSRSNTEWQPARASHSACKRLSQTTMGQPKAGHIAGMSVDAEQAKNASFPEQPVQ